jgi:hypothetical protein
MGGRKVVEMHKLKKDKSEAERGLSNYTNNHFGAGEKLDQWENADGFNRGEEDEIKDDFIEHNFNNYDDEEDNGIQVYQENMIKSSKAAARPSLPGGASNPVYINFRLDQSESAVAEVPQLGNTQQSLASRATLGILSKDEDDYKML